LPIHPAVPFLPHSTILPTVIRIMRGFVGLSIILLAYVLGVAADSITGTFESKLLPDTRIRYVQNSGVCETTPGVGQVSGYIEVGKNMSMVSFTLFLFT
jgi:hypothetical protein